jgi:hypothetical protein
VSKKRKLLLYTKLSEALKHFAVPVSKKEEEAEAELVEAAVQELPQPEQRGRSLVDIIKSLGIQGAVEAPADGGTAKG